VFTGFSVAKTILNSLRRIVYKQQAVKTLNYLKPATIEAD
jgi:hypothetical protein